MARITRRAAIKAAAAGGVGVAGVSMLSATAQAQPHPNATIGVPIGAILPYIGPLNQMPPGFELCDGRLISDPQADPMFKNKRVPNLTDNRFLMGISADGLVNQPGGSNGWERDGSHSHSGDTEGAILGGPTVPGGLQAMGPQRTAHTHHVSLAGGGHDHGDKRPAFLGVYYIVRIK